MYYYKNIGNPIIVFDTQLSYYVNSPCYTFVNIRIGVFMDIDCQHLVFVYGSMKKGFMNHFRLEGTAIFLGAASTLNSYAMYPDDSYKFPYVLKDKNRFPIQGELYSAGNDLLEILDIFEGHPKYYKREKIEVKINGAILESWIYFRSNSNPRSYDNSKLIDTWSSDLEYLGYKYLEDELCESLQNSIQSKKE